MKAPDVVDLGAVRRVLRNWVISFGLKEDLLFESFLAEDVAQEAMLQFLSMKQPIEPEKVMPLLQDLAVEILADEHDQEAIRRLLKHLARHRTPECLGDPLMDIFLREFAEIVVGRGGERDRRILHAFQALSGKELATVQDVADYLSLDAGEIKDFLRRVKRSYKAVVEGTQEDSGMPVSCRHFLRDT